MRSVWVRITDIGISITSIADGTQGRYRSGRRRRRVGDQTNGLQLTTSFARVSVHNLIKGRVTPSSLKLRCSPSSSTGRPFPSPSLTRRGIKICGKIFFNSIGESFRCGQRSLNKLEFVELGRILGPKVRRLCEFRNSLFMRAVR